MNTRKEAVDTVKAGLEKLVAKSTMLVLDEMVEVIDTLAKEDEKGPRLLSLGLQTAANILRARVNEILEKGSIAHEGI